MKQILGAAAKVTATVVVLALGYYYMAADETCKTVNPETLRKMEFNVLKSEAEAAQRVAEAEKTNDTRARAAAAMTKLQEFAKADSQLAKTTTSSSCGS